MKKLIVIGMLLLPQLGVSASVQDELEMLHEQLYEVIQSTDPDSVEQFSTITDEISKREKFLQHAGDRYIIVNKATYMLTAVDKGKEMLNDKVVIGRKEQPTPIMESYISTIETNPHWTVSQNTSVLITAPRFQKNPTYATAMGYIVYSDWTKRAVRLDPTEIDWQKHIDRGVIPYKIYQKPGKLNELGNMKFLVPNPSGREETAGIFIHGSPYKTLFNEDIREFSSGCVRMQKTVELAEIILGQPQATYLKKELNNGKTKRYNVERPMKLFIVDWPVDITKEKKVVMK